MASIPHRVRILVVEDEPDIRIIISEVLRSSYEVLTAENGLEALDRIDVYEPDLAVMDLMMPILDGIDTTRAIKKDARYSNMPVLFLTARKDNEAVRNALLAGGDIYLEKPFDPAQLLNALRDLITRHQISPRPKTHTVEEAYRHFNPVQEAPGVPLAQEVAETAFPYHGAGRAHNPLRMLVIDQSADILRAVRHRFGNRFEVVTTSDCELVPDKIIAYQPDIIVAEADVPYLCATNLALLGRVNKKLRAQKFILHTAHPEIYTAEKIRGLDISEILPKPFNPEALDHILTAYEQDPAILRTKKRLDFREILRRENPSKEFNQ